MIFFVLCWIVSIHRYHESSILKQCLNVYCMKYQKLYGEKISPRHLCLNSGVSCDNATCQKFGGCIATSRKIGAKSTRAEMGAPDGSANYFAFFAKQKLD